MEKKHRFSFRKTSVGLVSAMIMSLTVVLLAGNASAAEAGSQQADIVQLHYSQPPSNLQWTANTVEQIAQEIDEQLHTQDGTKEYVIQWGDTVWGITQAYGLDLNAFVKANGIENPNLIYTNDVVTLDVAPAEDASEVEESVEETGQAVTDEALEDQEVPVEDSGASVQEETAFHTDESEEIPTDDRPVSVADTVEETPAAQDTDDAEEAEAQDTPDEVRITPAVTDVVALEPVAEDRDVTDDGAESTPVSAEDEDEDNATVEDSEDDGQVVDEDIIQEGSDPADVPADEEPTEGDLIDEVIVDETQEEPVNDTPADEVPVEEVPVVEEPVEDEPAEEIPTEDEPVEETPVQEDPVEEEPTQEIPQDEELIDETVTRTIERVYAIAYGTEYIEDPNLPAGEEQVERQGVDGRGTRVFEQTVVNGEVQDEVQVSETVTLEPVTHVVRIGTYVPDVRTVRQQVQYDIPYTTDYEYTSDLAEGETEVLQQGVVGVREVTYEETVIDGEPQGDRQVVDEQIITEPVNERIAIGTGVEADDDEAFAVDAQVFNEEFLALVNAERARVGVGSLAIDPSLQEGADLRTQELLEMQDLNNHNRPDGSSWHTAFDYLDEREVFASGENLAQNWLRVPEYDTLRQTPGALEARMAQDFFIQFRNSPGHYANMINENHDGFYVSADIVPDETGDFMLTYHTMIFSRDVSD